MKAFSLLLATTAAFSFAAHADEEVISGTWYESDYQFAMSTEWEDVQGTWGESRYKLVWDSYDKILKGDTAGVYQELEFDDGAKLILGESYCGWIDLAYTEEDTVHLTGNKCLEPVDQTFADKAEMLAWVKDNVLPEMITEFPEPAREPVLNFLKRIINPF
jgi:hypothetical protein